MRILPTKVHAAIDYLWGASLIALPFLLGFDANRASLWTAIVFGAGATGYALLTDYELGAIKLLPMKVHLALDAVAGVALVLLPLVLDLDARARWPFIGFGAFAVVASLVTRTCPRASKAASPVPPTTTT